MTIDWASTQMYNTIMSIAAGVGMLLLVRLIWLLSHRKSVSLEGWAIGFAIPGFILTITGAVMAFTWPLSKVGFPFDDVIFAEPSLAFGVLMLAGTIILWRLSNYSRQVSASTENNKQKISESFLNHITDMVRPLSYFAGAMGLALVAIAAAGIRFQLFAAPPEEPISGQFADYPWIEAIFMSMLFLLTGIAAILFPISLVIRKAGITKLMSILWTITGVVFLVFGALNYFTHIGLIVNTMD